MRKTLATLAAGLLTAAVASAQMPPALAPPPRPVEAVGSQVFLSATIVQMPVKLVEQFRRDHAAADADPKVAAFTVADVVKLNAALRDEKGGGGIEILSRPNLMLTDRQTGFFQVGQQFPVVSSDGTPPITYVPTGLTLRVVPTIAADAQSVVLRTELKVASPNPTPVDLGNGKTTTAVDTQATEMTIRVGSGKTVIVPSEIIKGREVVTQVRLGDGPLRFTLRRTEKTQVVLILTAETDPAKMSQALSQQGAPPPAAVAPSAVCGNCYAETRAVQTMPHPIAVMPPIMPQACPTVAAVPTMPQAVAPPVVTAVAAKQILVQYTILDVPETAIDQVRKTAVVGTRADATTFDVLDGTAAIRTLKACPGVELFSRPSQLLTENQTGLFQVAQQMPVPNGTSQPAYVDVGFTLRTTPRLTPDGTILLRVEPRCTSLDRTPGDGTTTVSTDTQAAETTIRATDGRTTGIVTGLRRELGRKTCVVLFVTPKIIQSDAELRAVQTAFAQSMPAPASRPVAVVPPMMPQVCPVVAPVPMMPASPGMTMTPQVWTPAQPAPVPSLHFHTVDLTAFAGLRQAQDGGTQVETRFVTVPAGYCATTKLFAAGEKTAFLPPVVATAWLDQVTTERTATVVQSPKITLFNGQSSGVCLGNIVSVPAVADVRAEDGPAVRMPKMETVVLGTHFQVQATASADKKFVRLVCKGTMTEPAGPMSRFEIGYKTASGTTFVQPVAEKSSFHTLTFDRSVAVPDGHTMAVYVGRKPVTVTTTQHVSGPLSDIPYLSRLFTNHGVVVEEREVIALVTPRLYSSSAEEQKPVPAPSGEVAGLLAEYKAAVAAGKTEDAMKFALKALALDPGCFAR